MSSVVDNTGALWMVTFSAGAWRYDGKKVTHYPVQRVMKMLPFHNFKNNHAICAGHARGRSL
jgi:hypothetical protein